MTTGMTRLATLSMARKNIDACGHDASSPRRMYEIEAGDSDIISGIVCLLLLDSLDALTGGAKAD